jgi:hypothetical protein
MGNYSPLKRFLFFVQLVLASFLGALSGSLLLWLKAYGCF